MIKKLTILAVSLLASVSAFAADITFVTMTIAWDKSTEPDVVGYSLYFSQDATEWTHVKHVDANEATVKLTDPGTWFFVVTARDKDGLQSLPSDVLTYTTPTGPAKPGSLRIVSAVATQVSTVTTSTNLILSP
jgi:hypothetical protein